MRKRLVATLLALVLMLPGCIRVEAADISAKAAIVIEASTGTVLYEKNPDDKRGIASTTKIMTALVALELADMDEVVTIPKESVGVEGSSLYLETGEKMTIRELMYGLLLESGNDAAVAIAICVSGSVEAFVNEMNDYAARLGCTNTQFKNPNGLTEEGHYSTARDLAIMMAAAMENETFAEMTGTKSISFGNRTFQNHNKLLWNCEGVIGGKTGYTIASGRTLVSCAERDGMRLICVTLDDNDDWVDHAALYDEAYNGWKMTSVCTAGVPVTELTVISGSEDSVLLAPDETISFLCEKDETLDVSVSIDVPEFVYASVQEGASAGTLKVFNGGTVIASARLVYTSSIARNAPEKFPLWAKITHSVGFLFSS